MTYISFCWGAVGILKTIFTLPLNLSSHIGQATDKNAQTISKVWNGRKQTFSYIVRVTSSTQKT